VCRDKLDLVPPDGGGQAGQSVDNGQKVVVFYSSIILQMHKKIPCTQNVTYYIFNRLGSKFSSWDRGLRIVPSSEVDRPKLSNIEILSQDAFDMHTYNIFMKLIV